MAFRQMVLIDRSKLDQINVFILFLFHFTHINSISILEPITEFLATGAAQYDIFVSNAIVVPNFLSFIKFAHKVHFEVFERCENLRLSLLKKFRGSKVC